MTDFFPYDDSYQSYWSGFFSSRPALKGYIRQSEAWLRGMEVTNTVALAEGSRSNSSAALDPLLVAVCVRRAFLCDPLAGSPVQLRGHAP